MIDLNQPRNRLLAALPPGDWERMRPFFQEVDLPRGKLLADSGERFSHVYFPVSGVVCSVAAFEDGPSVEMATTGREGMVGVAAILCSETALARLIVQMPGSALAIDLDAFKSHLRDVPAFRNLLFVYAQVFLAQVLQSVACNGIHSVEQRAARWLLMSHDRTEGDSFALTQEFLAEMLGVSRPAVSIVSRTLQRAGLIHYSRGMITVRDRTGLEEASCECYKLIRSEYEQRLFRRLERSGASS